MSTLGPCFWRDFQVFPPEPIRLDTSTFYLEHSYEQASSVRSKAHHHIQLLGRWIRSPGGNRASVGVSRPVLKFACHSFWLLAESYKRDRVSPPARQRVEGCALHFNVSYARPRSLWMEAATVFTGGDSFMGCPEPAVQISLSARSF